jgi:hypothetical protein
MRIAGAAGGGAPAAGMASRRALAAGAALVLLYVAGAALSGSLSPAARRPLLDGLTPPTRYRWVKPPAALASGNKQPTPMRFTVALGPKGSEVGALGSQDGQVNVVFGEGAFAASPGQTEVAFQVVPLDPAPLAPVPAGLLPAGNAYRFTASYRPSDRPVDTLAGEANFGLVYPLLTTPVASASGHVLLYSPDGKAAWTRLESTDAPATHQVTARVPGPGYLLAAIPPAAAAGPGQSLAGRARGVLPVAALVAVLLAAAFVVLRRQAGSAAPGPVETPQARRERLREERKPRPPASPGQGGDAGPATSKPTGPKPPGGKRPGNPRRRRRPR